METRFLISIILSVIGVSGFLATVFFLGIFSILIALICYFIIYEKFREYFWKSFIIGIVIGLPLGFYSGFNLYMGYVSSPEYIQATEEAFQKYFQTGPKALNILPDNSFCVGNLIYLQVNNPSGETIKADEIRIEYIEGSCKNYVIEADEFKPNILEFEHIRLNGCKKGINTIKVISPEGEDQITLECKG